MAGGSPRTTVRLGTDLRDRVAACAGARGVTVSRFIRDALADRVAAVEAIEHAALRVQARRVADEARAEGDQRLAGLLDGLLLHLAVVDALYGPVVA